MTAKSRSIKRIYMQMQGIIQVQFINTMESTEKMIR